MMLNGNSNRTYTNFIFALGDGLIIIIGLFMGVIIRFQGQEKIFFQVDYLFWKIMLFILVIQTTFYYFDLYEVKNLKERAKTIINLMLALGISCIALAIIYYTVPALMIGRGLLAIGVLGILFMTFSWRLIYARIVGNKMFMERILIIGTGEMAKRITKEIAENGNDSYKIVGFVSEGR